MQVDSSFFSSDQMPSPEPMYKEPRFELDKAGRPSWIMADEMGCEHTFTDGACIRDAAFKGFNLAGVLVRDVEFDTVALIECRLANAELQDARIRRLVISGGEGGLVVKSSSIDEAKVAGITDDEAVVRFFDCELVGMLITDCNCGIDIARSSSVGLVLQRCGFDGRVVAIRESTLRSSRITKCTFTSARLNQANFFECSLHEVEFMRSFFEDVDMSLSDLADITLKSCRVHRLSLDAVIARTLKLFETRALHVTAHFADFFDVEIKGGFFAASFERAQVRSLMLLKVETYLTMKQSQTVGLRLCNVLGTIGGAGTTWWAPVIRCSILRGDGTRDITLIEADCTDTKVINDFGKWTNQKYQRNKKKEE